MDDDRSAPPDARVSIARAARAAAVALAPLALLSLAAPWFPSASLANPFVAFGCAATSVTLSGALAPRDVLMRPRAAALASLTGVALSLASLALRANAPALAGLAGALGIMLVACSVGTQVGARVESPGHILPVALLSAAVDLWSVTAASGPTHAIVQTPVLLRLLTVMAAVPPSRVPEPQIGFGDVVFTALYMAISERFGLSLRRTSGAIFAGILMAGLAAALLDAPVPALPALGLMMVLAHPEARRVPRADRKTALFTGALLAASIVRAAVTLAR